MTSVLKDMIIQFYPSVFSNHVHLRNKFHFSEVHRSLNAMGHMQTKWCAGHIAFVTSMSLRKMKFISYIYLLILDHFSIFVKFLFKSCKIIWRKVINQRVWLSCSTAVSLAWRQSKVTLASQLLHLSVTSLTHNVAWMSVVRRCMNLVSIK